MRIAVCFSGQLSRLNQHLDIFAEQVECYAGNRVDLFFALWGDECVTALQHKIENKIKPELRSQITIRKIELTHKCEWKSKHPSSKCWSRGNSPESICCMYKSIQKSDLLRQNFEAENAISYDLVIRSRPDILVVGNMQFEKWKNILDANKLIISPNNYNWKEHWTEDEMLNDLWFIAKPNTMTEIVKLADIIDDHVDAGCRLHPESLLWWHITKYMNAEKFCKSPAIKRYEFDCETILCRGKQRLK